MAKTHKRAFKSNPLAMGNIISQLIGGAHLPVCWFDSSEAQRWKQPIGEITPGQYGALSIVIDFSMIPQDHWDNAYLIDVQMRINELWPSLKLEVVFEGGLVGYYARLVNDDSKVTVGTDLDQTYSGNYGASWYTGPNGEPRRSTYNTDVSKFVIAGLQGAKFTLVHKDGRKLTPEDVKGDNHPEDFAWVVTERNPNPTIGGVLYSDLIAAARISGLEIGHNEDCVVTIY